MRNEHLYNKKARDKMKKLFINGREVKGIGFAFDGCHKIYIIEDEDDYESLCELWGNHNEPIYTLDGLESCYEDSCPLKFISTWKLEDPYRIEYVRQGEENVVFEWKEV